MSLTRTLIVLCMLLPQSPAFAADGNLDLSAVAQVRVTGEPGSVVLTSRRDAPITGMIVHRRHGWIGQMLSLWNYDECATTSRMRLDGDTLIVAIASSRLSSCHAVFTANLREGSTVTIEQPAAEVALSGVFDHIGLSSDAASVTFDGEARDMDLKGGALEARLSYTVVRGNETIRLDSTVMEADIRFARVDAISYRIDANAATVDSRYPHTQGAKPDIRITADKARISID